MKTATHKFLQTILLILMVGALGMACSAGNGTGSGASDTTSPKTCEFNGETYNAGEPVPAGDGCNSCTCSDTGEITQCSKMACPPPECSPEDCGPALGIPNMLCPDGVTTAGPGACEAQENGQCGWTITECPEDCATKACGESCTQVAACVSVCNADGQCVCDTGDPQLCLEDQCLDISCPPDFPGECDGNIAYGAYIYDCNPATGECDPSPSAPPRDCEKDGLICLNGDCVDGPNTGTCTPGESFLADDGCNTCGCPESGKKSEASCTEMACPDCESDMDCGVGATPPLCEGDIAIPSQAIGCNPETKQCEMQPLGDEKDCAKNGLVCLNGDCVDGPDSGTCTPGESFPAGDDCNMCSCPESGQKSEGICTEMACPEKLECFKDSDCADGEFCDFPYDDCGLWGSGGTCATQPEICVAGGSGACGCDGTSMTNGCEIQGGGTDVMGFGGCQGFGGNDGFACGSELCNPNTEYCSISLNDIAGPDQPEFYNHCETLPESCTQGDCNCMPEDFGQCYDGTGFTMMFYPGG